MEVSLNVLAEVHAFHIGENLPFYSDIVNNQLMLGLTEFVISHRG